MKREVISSYNSSKFGIQSGELLSTLMSDNPKVIKQDKGLIVGYGSLDTLNQVKRGKQDATFPTDDGKTISLTLSAEESLPKWLIVEFGRSSGSGSVSAKGVPKEFRVKYKSRKKKPYVTAPSTTKHNTKPVHFQTDMQDGAISTGGAHPGIKGARIFRTGLIKAQKDIHKNLIFEVSSIVHKKGE